MDPFIAFGLFLFSGASALGTVLSVLFFFEFGSPKAAMWALGSLFFALAVFSLAYGLKLILFVNTFCPIGI